jgi:hypothetical protein
MSTKTQHKHKDVDTPPPTKDESPPPPNGGPGGWQGAFANLADALDIKANSEPVLSEKLHLRWLAQLFRDQSNAP